MSSDRHTVLSPDTRPAALNVLGTAVTVLADSSATRGFGVTFQAGPENSGPPPHSHDWDEAFFVVSGEIHFQCGDEQYTCGPGAFVHVPRNTVHAFHYGTGGGSMLEVTSRDGRAAEMFTAIDAAVDPAAPDVATALRILQECGVRIAQ